jgi:hypothetical protein
MSFPVAQFFTSSGNAVGPPFIGKPKYVIDIKIWFNVCFLAVIHNEISKLKGLGVHGKLHLSLEQIMPLSLPDSCSYARYLKREENGTSLWWRLEQLDLKHSYVVLALFSTWPCVIIINNNK